MYSGGKPALLTFIAARQLRNLYGNIISTIKFSLLDTCRYDAAPNGQKPYRQKDGALLAVGALSDNLKQTEPYKSQLEQMLVQHVYPEFNSPVGHLRAKVRILDVCDIK
jgi:hypothetical protein